MTGAAHDEEAIEIPLLGGWVTSGVVRIGDTVRRPLSPRSVFVHQFLRELEALGFYGAPRFLGIDELGREVLSFVPGESLMEVGTLSDHRLRSGAQLLFRLHQSAAATSDELRQNHGVVLHGDAGPWNIIWRDDEAIALIDFDEARPRRAARRTRLLHLEGVASETDRPFSA
ncbi:MAG: phosphotransferase [Actinobacteria bacterium]|nr:phosphotransferase [Actinomycetota bacterium]